VEGEVPANAEGAVPVPAGAPAEPAVGTLLYTFE
jgi:hypothetical protein